MKARDVMTTTVVSVGPDTGVPEIARLLLERHISGCCAACAPLRHAHRPRMSLGRLLDGIGFLSNRSAFDRSRFSDGHQ